MGSEMCIRDSPASTQSDQLSDSIATESFDPNCSHPSDPKTSTNRIEQDHATRSTHARIWQAGSALIALSTWPSSKLKTIRNTSACRNLAQHSMSRHGDHVLENIQFQYASTERRITKRETKTVPPCRFRIGYRWATDHGIFPRCGFNDAAV